MAQILLVEDEIDLRDNLEIVLTHAGHEVLTAGDGREALTMIENAPPDLVVSDISMPVMSGLQMLARVRQTMPGLANMPIILLTALGDKENIIDGREAGADDYLTKPVDYQVLTATIDARLSRERQGKNLKDRQFVKLFKGLTKQPAAPVAAGPSSLERIAAIAAPSLRGRVQMIFPEDFLRDFTKLAPSTRDKVLAAMRRVLDSWLTESDVCIDLGGGGVLITVGTPDRMTALDRFTLLRMRLTQALGARPSDPAAAGPEGAPADDEGGDFELKETLKAHYFDSIRDRGEQNAPVAFDGIRSSFRIDYEPVWDVRAKEISAFRVGWRRRLDSLTLTGTEALSGGARDPLICDLVGMAMDEAAREVMAMRGELPQGHELPRMILPVPMSVFQSMSAYKVEQQIDDIARLLDRRSVGFHLIEVDEDVSMGALRKVFATLSRAGELLAADMNLNMSKFERLAAMGCRTLHVDAQAAAGSGLSTAQAEQILENSVRQAVGAGFDVWVSNVAPGSSSRRLAAAGAALLCGGAVGIPRPTADRTAAEPEPAK
jgi:CheY-like chemotaxis protein